MGRETLASRRLTDVETRRGRSVTDQARGVTDTCGRAEYARLGEEAGRTVLTSGGDGGGSARATTQLARGAAARESAGQPPRRDPRAVGGREEVRIIVR